MAHKPTGRPMHGPGAMMPGEKAKDFKGTMRKLLAYLSRFLPAVICTDLRGGFHRILHFRAENFGKCNHKII